MKLELTNKKLVNCKLLNHEEAIYRKPDSGCNQKQQHGTAVKEICRELGISDATFYNWKAKYGGMEVSDVAKVKATVLSHLLFFNTLRSYFIGHHRK